MKCPICDGTGVIHVRNIHVLCGKCQGIGFIDDDEPKPKKQMTEQEWLQTATTEQLAEWLRGVYWHCHEIDCEHCNYPWRCMEKGDIVEWLKQPHG